MQILELPFVYFSFSFMRACLSTSYPSLAGNDSQRLRHHDSRTPEALNLRALNSRDPGQEKDLNA